MFLFSELIALLLVEQFFELLKLIEFINNSYFELLLETIVIFKLSIPKDKEKLFLFGITNFSQFVWFFEINKESLISKISFN